MKPALPIIGIHMMISKRIGLTGDYLDDPCNVVNDEQKQHIEISMKRVLKGDYHSPIQDQLIRIKAKVLDLFKGKNLTVSVNLNRKLNGYRIGIYPRELDIKFRNVRDYDKQLNRIKNLYKQAGKFVAPIFILNKKGRNNGTVFFWNTGERTIMVTANHVYTDYLENKRKSHILDNSLDPEEPIHIDLESRHIDSDENLDIATFDINPNEMKFDTDVKKKCKAFEGAIYTNPKHNDSILFSGYPGYQITDDHFRKQTNYGICSFSTIITGVSRDVIRIDLDKQGHSIFLSKFDNNVTADYEFHINHLGGKSGCPLFKFNVNKHGVIQDELELCGVITSIDKEDTMPFKALPATRIDFIKSNGFIDKSNNPPPILGKKCIRHELQN